MVVVVLFVVVVVVVVLSRIRGSACKLNILYGTLVHSERSRALDVEP